MGGFLKDNIVMLYEKHFYIKNPARGGTSSWVDDGARTHDPQNHNLML